MNNARREKLKKALTILDEANNIIDQVYDQEQNCLENFPENLQSTERYDAMEAAVDNLTEAIDKIGEAIEFVQIAIEG